MSIEWEQYRDRFRLRPETFEAYVDVWTRLPGARKTFTGWASFSRAASAEPAQRARPDRIRDAEALMRAGGYEIGDPTSRGARRWISTRVGSADQASATNASGHAAGRVEDEWTSAEKGEVGLVLGQGFLRGGIAAVAAGILAAIIFWWRSGSQQRRNADAD